MVCYTVNHAARLPGQAISHRLAALGVTTGPLPTLLALHATDGQTQSELARRTGVEQPTMAVNFRRMERDGLLTRTPAPPTSAAPWSTSPSQPAPSKPTCKLSAGIDAEALTGFIHEEHTQPPAEPPRPQPPATHRPPARHHHLTPTPDGLRPTTSREPPSTSRDIHDRGPPAGAGPSAPCGHHDHGEQSKNNAADHTAGEAQQRRTGSGSARRSTAYARQRTDEAAGAQRGGTAMPARRAGGSPATEPPRDCGPAGLRACGPAERLAWQRGQRRADRRAVRPGEATDGDTARQQPRRRRTNGTGARAPAGRRPCCRRDAHGRLAAVAVPPPGLLWRRRLLPLESAVARPLPRQRL